MTNPPLLSLCMIVKNEEAMLHRCLRSVRDYVDEMIIIDTGSKDRTVEIAKEFGAKVFHHKWENDFAKHRNQAIDNARGEWILMLDADEELKEGGGDVLRQAIRNEEIDSIEVTNISFFNNGSSEAWVNQTRLFRNRSEIYYSDIVHEQLLGTRNTKRYPIYIKHYGYDLDKDYSQIKHERNVRLIKEQIMDDPGNFFYHLNLAVSYSTHFDFSEAVKEGLTALGLASERGIMDDNVLWAQYIVSSAYFKLNDLDNAEKLALTATSSSQEHLDSYFILALVYHQKKDWAKLSKICSKLFGLYSRLKFSPESFGSRLIHMANEEWRIHVALGDLYLNNNDSEKAQKEFYTARSLSPSLGEYFKLIGDCFKKAGLLDQAEENYKASLVQQENNTDANFGMALLYKKRNNERKYREFMEKINLNNITSPDIFFEKGLICLKDKDYESSINFFESAVSLRPDFFHALQNLSLAYKYLGKLSESLDTGLRALELRPESTDVRINIGHLCYELNEFNLASDMFESVVGIAPELIDIRLILCEVYVITGEIEKCVYECDRILKELDLPRDVTLNNISDLAGLFLLIGQALNQTGTTILSAKAEDIACQLDPQIKEKTVFS